MKERATGFGKLKIDVPDGVTYALGGVVKCDFEMKITSDWYMLMFTRFLSGLSLSFQ